MTYLDSKQRLQMRYKVKDNNISKGMRKYIGVSKSAIVKQSIKNVQILILNIKKRMLGYF